MNIKYTWIAVLLSLTILSQQVNADGIINTLQYGFKTSVQQWYAPLQAAAHRLLLALAVISYTWKAIFLVIRQADIAEFLAELLRMILFTGFFVWLIFEAPQLMETLRDGWVWLAGTATGTQWSVSVDLIFERGLDLGGLIFDQGDWYNGSALLYGIFALIVIFMYAIMAAYAFFVIAEMYVITAAGVILLGFGSTEWTREYAMRYLTYCMSIGAKMYVMFLVLGAGESMINGWAVEMVASEDPKGILGLIGVLLILVILVKMIPDAMAGIINGTSIGSGTPNVAGIAAMAAGSAVATAAIATGSGQTLSAAKQAAGAALGPNASVGGTAAHMAKTMSSAAIKTAGHSVMGSNPDPGGSNRFSGRMASSIKQSSLTEQAKLDALSDRLYPPTSPGGGSIGSGKADKPTDKKS